MTAVTHKRGECGACNFETKLTKSPRWRRSDGANATDEVWLCEVCENCYSGNAVMYPMNYSPEVSTILNSFAACTNMILAEMRKKK